MLEILGLILTIAAVIAFFPIWSHAVVLAWKIYYDPEIEFEKDSLDMKFFELCGYDDYVMDYFEDFNNKTKKTFRARQVKYYMRGIGGAILGVALGYWPLAAVLVGFYATMSLLDKHFMDYYYWTYYEVEMKLVPKEDGED